MRHRRALVSVGSFIALTVAAAIGSSPSEARPPESPSARPAPVDTAGSAGQDGLDRLGLDLTGLDEGQRRWLRELMDKYPSLCGKPHSLLTSLRSDPSCKRSPFGARYLARLLKAGLMKSECEEFYEARFVTPEKGKCNLADSPVRGDPKAPIVICEFSDFQCPHCKQAEPLFEKLLAEVPQVRLYFKNYPISKLHPEARDAASAAVAAGRQGKFWAMHDILFKNQDRLSPADLERYAAELKLDVKKWKADLPAARERVEKERAEGEALEISGTPSIYINGRKYRGPLRYDELRDWVDEELAR